MVNAFGGEELGAWSTLLPRGFLGEVRNGLAPTVGGTLQVGALLKMFTSESSKGLKQNRHAEASETGYFRDTPPCHDSGN